MEDLTTPKVSRRDAFAIGAVGLAAICLGCTNGSGHESDTETRHHTPTPNPSPDGLDAFGGLVPAGSLTQIRRAISGQQLLYVSEARTYLVSYPAGRIEAAKASYPSPLHRGLDAGLLALHQKCTHLGCRVPFCSTADEFQCPCHDGVYSRVGEYRSGPPPRGLDLFPIVVIDEKVWIDTGRLTRGLARTVSPSGLARTGASCI